MTEQDTMPTEAVELMGAIVAQNVSDLAHTTDRIIDNLERTVADLATTIVYIERILEDALVIDRKTENELGDIAYRFDQAHDLLRDRKMIV